MHRFGQQKYKIFNIRNFFTEIFLINYTAKFRFIYLIFSLFGRIPPLATSTIHNAYW